jgi:phosphatidylglycerol---prolipoprotein diacylglyceryl transferase
MLPVLQIGRLAIQVPGLILLAGIWAGLSLAEPYADRRGIAANSVYNLVIVSLICGVLGARLVYVLRYPDAFLSSPFSLISLNPGLLDLWGGLAAGLAGGFVYAQHKHMKLWSILDALTPLLGVMAVAIALSNLASGTAFGKPGGLPWSIHLWGADRHPSQVYSALASGIILVIFWPARQRWQNTPPGRYFLGFTACSAAAMLFLEAFRGDSLLLPGGFRAAQIIAWLLLAASLFGIQK